MKIGVNNKEFVWERLNKVDQRWTTQEAFVYIRRHTAQKQMLCDLSLSSLILDCMGLHGRIEMPPRYDVTSGQVAKSGIFEYSLRCVI